MKLILFLIIYFIKNVRGSKYTHYGNELEQFEAYEKLTKDFVNETEFFQLTDDCERSTIPQNGFRSYVCRFKLREDRQLLRKPIWNRKIDPEVKKKTFKVDCKYGIEMNTLGSIKYGKATIKDGSLLFSITQSNCESEFSKALGGSTFEIYLQSIQHLAVCNVIDLFTNSYSVYCPLPTNIIKSAIDERSGNGGKETLFCSNVSTTLHYEHYDAFCDIGHSKFSSLHHSVYKGQICAILNKNEISNAVATTSKTDGITNFNENSDQLWLLRPDKSIGQHHQQQPQYEWRGQIAKYLTISAMKQCLKRQTLWFIGESHMRYQFDITMDRYVDKLKMGRYHGSVNVSGVSYSDNTFSTRLIAFLDTLPCPTSSSDNSQQPQTLVLQTGSWDLQFFPPRAYIRNPSQGSGVVAAIRRLKHRAQCSRVYNIIWMSTMPHPYCTASHEHCIRLMNYWRNNGAIRAVNQFMAKELTAVQYPGLTILDTLTIALPRFPLHEIVCVDHFLCNDQPRGFITTPTGIAISNEVLTTACAQEFSSTTAAVSSASRIPSVFRDGGLFIVTNTTRSSTTNTNNNNHHYQWFSVEGGCRREYPDEITLQLMGLQSPQSFTPVSIEYILDIPVCFRTHFLTRLNGTLYQTYSTKSVYYMDNGYRRPVQSIQTLIQLGRDLDEVKFVLEKDFEMIPLGRQLVGKSDCDWCNS